MTAMTPDKVEAARECVPYAISASMAATLDYSKGWDACRETTLTNLTALEQGVGK